MGRSDPAASASPPTCSTDDTVVYDPGDAAAGSGSDRRATPSVSAVAFQAGRADWSPIGTIDGRVQLFDANERRGSLGDRIVERNAMVWQVAFSPGRPAARGGRRPERCRATRSILQRKNGVAELWDVRLQTARRTEGRAGSRLGVHGGILTPTASLLATGSYRGQLDLWDVATRKHPTASPMLVAGDGVLSVAFDPSSELLAAGGSGTGGVRVWRVADQRPAFPPLAGHTGNVVGTAFDPDGTFLATSTLSGGTRLWDPAIGLGYGGELASGAPGPHRSCRPSSCRASGLWQRVQRGRQAAGRPWGRDPPDAVGRRPGGLARRACAIVGRNLTPEEWRLYLPSGTNYRATCPQWPIG